ncbi:MAG: flagellin [bacterium]|nr:flagellin [bacterium]
MSIGIKTNVPSITNNRLLTQKSEALNKSFEKLSSGKRINNAADDPAGLAVALSLATNASLDNVAMRNISDGVSLANVAESALESGTQITTRMAELSMRSANGTVSNEQRQAMDAEYQQLASELDRISATTEFNGQKLFDGSGQVTIQAGNSGDQTGQISLSLPSLSSASLNLGTSLTDQAASRDALDRSRQAVNDIASVKGEVGSMVSRLGEALESARASELAEKTAASRIMDTDIAAESAELVKNQIGLKASTAMQAQANLNPQMALKLLT